MFSSRVGVGSLDLTKSESLVRVGFLNSLELEVLVLIAFEDSDLR